MKSGLEARADILGAITARGLEAAFRDLVTQHGASVGNVLGIVLIPSAIAARAAWWAHLGELGWTDLEIAELHRVPRRTVSAAILRRLRRSA